MKKLTFLGTMLLAAALIFTGCKDPKDETNEFSDCSETVTAVELSEGTWTLKQTETAPAGKTDLVITATVDAEGNYTFTSLTQTIDGTIPAEYRAEWDAMSEDEKKAFAGEGAPEGAQITINGYNVKMVAQITDASQLAMYKSMFDLDMLADAVEDGSATIKTNSDKTKYVITVTDEDGETSTTYLSKN